MSVALNLMMALKLFQFEKNVNEQIYQSRTKIKGKEKHKKKPQKRHPKHIEKFQVKNRENSLQLKTFICTFAKRHVNRCTFKSLLQTPNEMQVIEAETERTIIIVPNDNIHDGFFHCFATNQLLFSIWINFRIALDRLVIDSVDCLL